jgi:uncharacterized metal-binding protein YceD (DUF177 family)
MMRAIDVRDLLENPGASRTVRVQEPVPGLRTELADVPEDAPIAADLTLEGVVEGIYVRGSLEGRFVLRCARCLKAFERDFDVEMTELVAREPGPDDDYALAPDLTLDPEPIVRDAVVLEMPFSAGLPRPVRDLWWRPQPRRVSGARAHRSQVGGARRPARGPVRITRPRRLSES